MVNGVVYVGCATHVCALNARTGAKLWGFATGSGVASSPAVANGIVYVGSNDGNLYALRASSGAKLWSFGVGVMDFSSPAVANGVVYAGAVVGDGNLYALNAVTGVKIWSYATGGSLI